MDIISAPRSSFDDLHSADIAVVPECLPAVLSAMPLLCIFSMGMTHEQRVFEQGMDPVSVHTWPKRNTHEVD
jgi:hypothetical protein